MRNSIALLIRTNSRVTSFLVIRIQRDAESPISLTNPRIKLSFTYLDLFQISLEFGIRVVVATIDHIELTAGDVIIIVVAVVVTYATTTVAGVVALATATIRHIGTASRCRHGRRG